jgi:hypothetical protein
MPVGDRALREPAAGPRLYLDHGGVLGRFALATEALAGQVDQFGNLVGCGEERALYGPVGLRRG